MSQPYNSTYRPPFPQLTVELDNGEDRLGPFSALVDTGADVTFVPTHLLEEISALESVQAKVRSHFGEVQSVQLYLIGFRVDSIALAGFYVVGDDAGDTIILGRDVLNKLPLFLDGPEKQTTILDETVVQRLRKRKKS